MKLSWVRRSVVALAAALAVTAGIAPGAAHATGGQPQVFPPGSSPYGKSYREWSARWWQWAYSVPASVNPLFDETGAKCGQGQSGKVWYLAGVFNASGTASRECDVPEGKALLFPILNDEFDNKICIEPNSHFSVKTLRSQAKQALDSATNLTAQVDGVSIDPTPFRTTSPTFNIKMPEGNIAQELGCVEGAGTYAPVVGDGWYIMLKPLSHGVHTVSFSGEVTDGPFAGFALSISYTLHVG